jgi:hypothetical protein
MPAKVCWRAARVSVISSPIGAGHLEAATVATLLALLGVEGFEILLFK